MKRIIQLDFFRGLFLVVITINHFLSNDNIIKKFTSEFIGWMSAAEGFVFLSGFTVGLIYTYYYQEKGEKYIKRATRNRAWTIYKNHFALFGFALILLLITHSFLPHWAPEYKTIYQQPVLAAFLGSLLLYQPPLLDILPMYAVFMLLVPLAIKNFTKGQYWPVLITSFVIYLVGTFNLAEPNKGYTTWDDHIFLGVFNPWCWQFLFFGGLFLGFWFRAGKVRAIQNQRVLFFLAVGISLLLFGLKQSQITINGFDLQYWADKEHIRPLRLFNFICLTFVMTFIVYRHKEKFLFRPLNYLGKYSLQVFVLHVVLVLLFRPLRAPLNKLLYFKVTSYSFYPLETLLLIFILMALFLAPTLLNKDNFTYLFNKNKADRKLATNAK